MFSYLTEQNLQQNFKDSEKVMTAIHEPLKEYERIGRNKPHPNIDKAYPKVTDGTLSSIVNETPKRVVQQIPTGTVETSMGEWFDVFASWKLTEDIIPHANCQADVIQKSWRAITNSLTYGSCPAYVYFDNYEDYEGGNFKIPYITHVYLQKWKISDKESNFIFLEGWYQELDIDFIIDRETAYKKENPDYKGEWDIKALKEVKRKKETKNDDQKTPSERDNSSRVEDDGIRIIHAFQKGKDALFYSFTHDGTIVRRKKNPDPRGVIPIHFLYYNLDLSNPLGRGIIELSGGMQNLLDSHTQAFQYMQALMYNPPLKKRGNIPQGGIKFIPNAIWDMGDSPQNDVEPVSINTSALSNFPQTYGLIKSQILNLNNSPDSSVSAEAGNPGFSKTDSGVKQIQARLGVSDNYIKKQYEAWFGDVCETLLNITFAELTGVREEVLDSKTADKLRGLIPEGNEVITWIDIENSDSIAVDYSQLGQEPIIFTVDASTSSVKENGEQIENITAFMELMQGLGGLPPEKQMSLVNRLIDKFGLENPEEIKFSPEEIEAVAMQAQQQQMMDEQMAQEQAMAEQMPQELPEEQMMQEQPEDEPTEEEAELAAELADRGLNEEQIGQAIILMRQGVPEAEIAQALMGGR